MTDPYGQDGPTPPQGVPPQSPCVPGQPQNPYPPNPAPQGAPQPGPYAQGQPQNPYPQGPANPYAAAQPVITGGPAKQGIGRRILSFALIPVLLAAGWIVYKTVGVGSMKPGDCVVVTGTKSSPNVKKVGCGDANAVYAVTAVDSTCDESESEYTETNRGLSTKLCLYYNVNDGDCITRGNASSVSTKGTCAKGSYKVVRVLKDTSDENECPDMTEFTVPNVTRNKVICLTEVV